LRINLSIDYNITIRRDSGLLEHTFLPGHKIMVHVQSTWFPLIDRNPQKFVPNIFQAEDSDFIAARHRLFHTAANPSHLEFLAATPPQK
jgi:predicted acyl esterase